MSNSPRVLVCGVYGAHVGSARAVLNLLHFLVEEKVAVDCLVPETCVDRPPPGVSLLTLPSNILLPGCGVRDMLSKAKEVVRRSRLTMKTAQALKKNRYDLVLVQDVRSHELFSRVSGYVSGKKYFVLHTGPDYLGGLAGKSAEAPDYIRHRNRLLAYDGYIAVSEYIKQNVTMFELPDDRNITVIPNTAPEAEIHEVLQKTKGEVRKKLGFGEGKTVFVIPGSVQYRKGQDLVVQMVRENPEKFKQIEFKFVGLCWDSYGGHLSELVAHETLENIQLLGPQSNVLEYIYGADGVIVPSRVEAQGIVVLEAMALGTPVIGANLGGIPEMVRDGQEALLFNPNTAGDLARVFDPFLQNPALVSSLRDRARTRYTDVFSNDRYKKNWLNFLWRHTGRKEVRNEAPV